MDNYPISSNSLEKFYYIDGNHFGQQYKEYLSGYNQWEQKDHAEDWILFPENIGDNLSLDETSLSTLISKFQKTKESYESLKTAGKFGLYGIQTTERY